jgi:hypothetical protein
MATTTNSGKKIVTQKSGHVAVADGTSDVYNEQGKPVPYANTVPCSGVKLASTNTTIGDAVVSLFRSFYTPADQIHGVPAGASSGGMNGPARPLECSKDVKIEGLGPERTDDKTKHNTTAKGNTTGKHVEGKAADGEGDKKPCVEWEYIKGIEKTRNDGYVPANVNPKTGKLERIQNSGITVATGVDLGQQDPSTLGLTDDLAKKLQPYHGISPSQINDYANAYPGKNGTLQLTNWAKKNPKAAAANAAAAQAADAPKPLAQLNLKDGEVKELDAKVKAKFENNLAKAFNRKTGTKFVDLPCKVQTALMSSFYNGGATSDFMSKIRSGDYAGARDSLFSADTGNNGVDARRHGDGELLNDPLPKDQKQTYDQWKAAQDAAAAKAAADKAAPKPGGH